MTHRHGLHSIQGESLFLPLNFSPCLSLAFFSLSLLALIWNKLFQMPKKLSLFLSFCLLISLYLIFIISVFFYTLSNTPINTGKYTNRRGGATNKQTGFVFLFTYSNYATFVSWQPESFRLHREDRRRKKCGSCSSV